MSGSGDVLRRSPDAGNRSLGELMGQLTGDLSTLLRQEVELAKLETKEEVQRAGRAGAMLGVAAVAGFLTAVLASFALAAFLDNWMHAALAFLLTALLWAAAAAVLAIRGRQQLRAVRPVPEQTIATLKEDLAWARAQSS